MWEESMVNLLVIKTFFFEQVMMLENKLVIFAFFGIDVKILNPFQI